MGKQKKEPPADLASFIVPPRARKRPGDWWTTTTGEQQTAKRRGSKGTSTQAEQPPIAPVEDEPMTEGDAGDTNVIENEPNIVEDANQQLENNQLPEADNDVEVNEKQVETTLETSLVQPSPADEFDKGEESDEDEIIDIVGMEEDLTDEKVPAVKPEPEKIKPAAKTGWIIPKRVVVQEKPKEQPEPRALEVDDSKMSARAPVVAVDAAAANAMPPTGPNASPKDKPSRRNKRKKKKNNGNNAPKCVQDSHAASKGDFSNAADNMRNSGDDTGDRRRHQIPKQGAEDQEFKGSREERHERILNSWNELKWSRAPVIPVPVADVPTISYLIRWNVDLQLDAREKFRRLPVAEKAEKANASIANLLPSRPLELYPDEYDDVNKVCRTNQVLRAEYDKFALPQGTRIITVLASVAVYCNGTDRPASQTAGVLFRLDKITVQADCQANAITAIDNSGNNIAVNVALGTSTTLLEIVLRITLGSGLTRLAVCDGATSTSAYNFLSPLQPSDYSVTIGSDQPGKVSARASFEELWITTDSIELAWCPLSFDALYAAERSNNHPVITSFYQEPLGDVFVGDVVLVGAQAMDQDAENNLRLSITFFGLPSSTCNDAECGDLAFSTSSLNSPILAIKTAVAYPKPGKYLVRATVSDGNGVLSTRDLTVIVRKTGDFLGKAPCCRQTSYITASGNGRPIHDTKYRPESVTKGGTSLGWSSEYMTTNDLEAERLFDYSILAPTPLKMPLHIVSCHDSRVAGAGSPSVYGVRGRHELPEVSGRGKKLVIVPLAFPWGTTETVECEKHWSGWHRDVPYYQANGDCSVGCSASSTRFLISNTGMFDQFNQALIQSSYGALSMSPSVTILDDVIVPKEETTIGDAYSYYDEYAKRALSKQGLPYWMHLVLSPLAYHKAPAHRAWSRGMGAKGITITSCFASHYYTIHETGHRLGFGHTSVYQPNTAGNGGVQNPFGPGVVDETGGYNNRFDTQGCCKSDYGLYYRIAAGWIPGTSRITLASNDLQQSSKRTYVLWPFDRPESRDNLMAVTLRISPGDFLVMGFRSAAHWQEARNSSSNGSIDDSRNNVKGLQVEYVQRSIDSQMRMKTNLPPESAVHHDTSWSDPSLLNFNLLHQDYSLKSNKAEYFALMKEGRSWYEPSTKTLISFESIGPCDATSRIPLYNYTAKDFYGFAGYAPDAEHLQFATYSGYSSMECAVVTLTTATESPPASPLNIKLTSPADNCTTDESKRIVRLNWSLQDRIASIVVKGMLSQTLTTYVPKGGGYADITLPVDSPTSLSILAKDGRHTRLYIAQDKSSMNVEYTYYQPDQIVKALERVKDDCSIGKQQRVALIAGIAIVGSLILLTALVLVIYRYRKRYQFTRI